MVWWYFAECGVVLLTTIGAIGLLMQEWQRQGFRLFACARRESIFANPLHESKHKQKRVAKRGPKMRQWVVYALCAGLLFLPGGGFGLAAQTLSNVVVTASASELNSSIRPAVRQLSLVEQGYTDRIIIKWKQDKSNIANADGKAAAAWIVSAKSAATESRKAKVREERIFRVTKRASDAGTELSRHRQLDGSADVLRMPAKLSPSRIAALRAKLLADPDIADVYPDRIYFPALTPNDPCFAIAMPNATCPTSQWNLSAGEGINAEAAWSVTTGQAAQIIAIIDTGIVNHPEFYGRVLRGYDFVSNSDRPRSNDNDGRDSDATDPGDAVRAEEAASGPFAGCPVQAANSWHGTTMAGVIAGSANNGIGVAGVNWNAKILPVRAVGKCGGYESDIINGLLWAAGVSQPGLPNVPTVNEVLPGFVVTSWWGIVAPPETPAAISNRISAAVGEIMKQPDVTTRLNDMSMVSTGSSSAEFAKFINAEAERWGKVIRISGAKAQ